MMAKIRCLLISVLGLVFVLRASAATNLSCSFTEGLESHDSEHVLLMASQHKKVVSVNDHGSGEFDEDMEEDLADDDEDADNADDADDENDLSMITDSENDLEEAIADSNFHKHRFSSERGRNSLFEDSEPTLESLVSNEDEDMRDADDDEEDEIRQVPSPDGEPSEFEPTDALDEEDKRQSLSSLRDGSGSNKHSPGQIKHPHVDSSMFFKQPGPMEPIVKTEPQVGSGPMIKGKGKVKVKDKGLGKVKVKSKGKTESPGPKPPAAVDKDDADKDLTDDEDNDEDEGEDESQVGKNDGQAEATISATTNTSSEAAAKTSAPTSSGTATGKKIDAVQEPLVDPGVVGVVGGTADPGKAKKANESSAATSSEAIANKINPVRINHKKTKANMSSTTKAPDQSSNTTKGAGKVAVPSCFLSIAAAFFLMPC